MTRREDPTRQRSAPSGGQALQHPVEPGVIDLAWHAAVAAEHGKRYGAAVSAYRRVVGRFPGCAEAWNNMGNALMAQGELDEALDCYTRARTLAPERYESWFNYGNAKLEQSCPDEAIEAYREALQRAPSNDHVWFNLGYALSLLDDLPGAIDAYRQAVELASDNHRAWYNLGNAYADLDRHGEAIDAYRNALEHCGDDHEIWNNLGAALSHAERYEEAISSLQMALELCADYDPAWNNLAGAREGIGDLTGAAADYAEALRRRGDRPLYHVNRASVLARLGRRDEASVHLVEAIRLDEGVRDYLAAFDEFADLPIGRPAPSEDGPRIN